MLISIYYSKNFFMDFVRGLSLSIDEKSDNYDKILVIIYYLTKIVDYKPDITTIDIVGLVKVITSILVIYYNLLNLIINNQGSLFILKF